MTPMTIDEDRLTVRKSEQDFCSNASVSEILTQDPRGEQRVTAKFAADAILAGPSSRPGMESGNHQEQS